MGISSYTDIIFDKNRFLNKKQVQLIQITQINWVPIIKLISKTLLLNLKSLSLKQYFIITIIIISIFITLNNFAVAITIFYDTYKLKTYILRLLDPSVQHLLYSKILINEFQDFYILNEILVFFLNFMWNAVFGILMIIPILLIIAYSTLLERKVLSSAQ